jgi:DsbC/DsbD-like thiol-disulfide interchange protein
MVIMRPDQEQKVWRRYADKARGRATEGHHTCKMRRLGRLLSLLLVSALLLPATATATDGWQAGYKHRTRLIAKTVPTKSGAIKRYAFFQIELEPGWKTYWRHPGEAGGIPPDLSTQDASNLKSAKLLYPAPKRMSDEVGDTIGYKDHVTFPIVVEAEDPTKPVELKLQINFGICDKICVPADASYDVTLPTKAGAQLSDSLQDVIDRIPHQADERQSSDPKFLGVGKPDGTASASGDIAIPFSVRFPEGLAGADAFIEAPAGLFVPVPQKKTELDSKSREYVIVLRQNEYQDLKGKMMRLTMVSNHGNSEAEFQLP